MRKLFLEAFLALVECGHRCPVAPGRRLLALRAIIYESPPCISSARRQGNAPASSQRHCGDRSRGLCQLCSASSSVTFACGGAGRPHARCVLRPAVAAADLSHNGATAFDGFSEITVYPDEPPPPHL